MHKEGVKETANKLFESLKNNYRTQLDDREQYSPDYKFNDWEMGGVPVRVELEPKDIENNKCVIVRRDTQEKNEKANKWYIGEDNIRIIN